MSYVTAESKVEWLPTGRAFTRPDLDPMPDDGNRYDLIDGSLIVTPAPSWRHQSAVLNLAMALKAVCPADMRVFVAPLEVTSADDTVLEPDVLVVRRSDLGEDRLEGDPLLAVEGLSPTTGTSTSPSSVRVMRR